MPFHCKVKAWEIWEPGHHYYWYSFTYHSARYKGAYSPLLVIRYFFLADGPFICTTLFIYPDKSNVFKGWLALQGWQCIIIPQELVVNFVLVFDPVAQLFVFPAFQVCSFSMSMLVINKILELLIQNFVMMVLFLQRCLFFAIFWSLQICNIASLFFSDLSHLTFSHIFIWVLLFSTILWSLSSMYLYKVSTSRYWFTTLYSLYSYIKISP